MKNKIGFKDLNAWLKVLVVWGWIILGFYAIGFLLGFFEGLLS